MALDPVGAGTWPLSMGALAQGGRYATCGILTGAEVQLNLGPFYTRQQQVIGSTGGSRGDLATVLAALQAGRIEAPIWRTYPLEEAPAAFAALKSLAASARCCWSSALPDAPGRGGGRFGRKTERGVDLRRGSCWGPRPGVACP